MKARELNPIPPALQSTPWGNAHGAYEYAEGLIFVHTASHGGLYCSAARWGELMRAFPAWRSFNNLAGWLEEDEDFALGPLLWPEAFDPQAVFNAVRTATAAAAAYREPNPWPAVTAWLQSPAGAAVLKIAAEYEKTIAGQWERGGLSGGGGRPGWLVSLYRGKEHKAVLFKAYPEKQFYTEAELAALELKLPAPGAVLPVLKPAVKYGAALPSPDEGDYGGAFDGRQVTSDADPGL
jgi:hypothetical protein